MKRWTALCAGIAVLTVVAGAPAFAQAPKPDDCRAKAPEKVDGQITRVDPVASKITVKDKSGVTHEFQASKEMMQTAKPGDKIEATLREAPKC